MKSGASIRSISVRHANPLCAQQRWAHRGTVISTRQADRSGAPGLLGALVRLTA